MYHDMVGFAIAKGKDGSTDFDGYRVAQRCPALNGYCCPGNKSHIPDAPAEFSCRMNFSYNGNLPSFEAADRKNIHSGLISWWERA